MKVSMNVNKTIALYSSQETKSRDTRAVNKSGDRIEISSEGKNFLKYIDASKDYDIKNEKADGIKKLIDDKNYNVDSTKLADAMMKYAKNKKI